MRDKKLTFFIVTLTSLGVVFSSFSSNFFFSFSPSKNTINFFVVENLSFHTNFIHFLQCAKLLLDTENPILYPIKYVYIADIFDKFGELVYERLKNRAAPPPFVCYRC